MSRDDPDQSDVSDPRKPEEKMREFECVKIIDWARVRFRITTSCSVRSPVIQRYGPLPSSGGCGPPQKKPSDYG